MKKIDHVRKTVYIIVGILTIISLVFSLYKKIGHCQESTIYVVDYPLPYGIDSGLGFSTYPLTQDIIDGAVAYLLSGKGSDVQNKPFFICVGEVGSNNSFITFGFYVNRSNTTFFNQPTGSFGSTTAVTEFVYTSFYQVKYMNGSYSFVNSSYNNNIRYLTFRPFQNSSFFNTEGSYFYPNVYCFNYPLAFYDSSWTELTSVSYGTNYGGSNQPIYKKYTPAVTPGHSKGGVLANYVDSFDIIESDSSLPSVDVTPPSDQSSISSWLGKILTGLGKINDSIKSGVLTIGDFIGQGFENVINWFTEPFDSDQFNSDLNQIALINDFSNLKTLVENCGMFDWSDVTPAQSVSFTFDFGGSVLPHTQTVVDFSWYTGTVKNICVAVICTFLVLGLLVTIINQLPNIIGGKSGDKGGGSDS